MEMFLPYLCLISLVASSVACLPGDLLASVRAFVSDQSGLLTLAPASVQKVLGRYCSVKQCMGEERLSIGSNITNALFVTGCRCLQQRVAHLAISAALLRQLILLLMPRQWYSILLCGLMTIKSFTSYLYYHSSAGR